MNNQEFLDLLWQIEEMLMHVDYLRGQIGKCPEKCEGLDAVHDEGLCPACCDWFAKVQAEEERLAQNMEFNEVMEMLKRACDEDKSGQYRRLLEQSREGKVVH